MKLISRRDFLKTAGASAVVATTVAMVGCSAESTSTATDSVATDSTASSYATTADPTATPTATLDPTATPEPTPDPTTTPEPTPTGPVIEEIDGITYVDGILIANKTYALPQSYSPGQLSVETVTAFDEMESVASAQGLNLYISSGFRSYDRQNTIYNNYVARDGQAVADTYSARPGHSEHQTGLAFDLNTIDSSFANTAEGQWVAVNAHLYGLLLRYPEGKTDITGYKYEPWHLRYLGVELATDVYNSGLCLEEYLGITSVYQY